MQPTLFDDEQPPEWKEVPQARFLSWSKEMQLAYCAARDFDSAVRELDDVWWAEFYSNRAKKYIEIQLNGLGDESKNP